MPAIIQPSFSTGELAPKLFSRVDISKYHSAVELGENMLVDYRGGMTNRAGTQWIGQCITPAAGQSVRLIPFIFSVTQAYILEFGDHYMRVIDETTRSFVLSPTFTITGISNLSPATVNTSVPHNLSPGTMVFISGVSGMTQINNRFFTVQPVLPNAVSLFDLQGNPVNSIPYGVYSGGGTLGAVYVINTLLSLQAVNEAKFDQSADVMTIVHPNITPQEVRRLAANNWTISSAVFGPTIPPVVGGGSTQVPMIGGTTNRYYVITSVDANGVESIPSSPIGPQIVNFNGSYIQVSWTPAAAAVSYNVYAAGVSATIASGTIPLYGYIGYATTNQFNDTGIVPDFSITPPLHRDPINTIGSNFPRACAYYQQRHFFGGSDANPITIYGTRTGEFQNMDIHNPVLPDDAIEADLVSQQLNPINNMIAMPTGLLVLTALNAWLVSGAGQNQGITPSNISAIPQASIGSANLAPVLVGNDLMYLTFKGNTVRSLSFDWKLQSYASEDISVMSSHLFENVSSLTSWAYADAPYKMLWAVRGDGTLLTLAYLKEQEVNGWSHHTTPNGTFGNVCVVPSTTTDDVYVVVTRGSFQFIERFANDRKFSLNGISGSWFLDSALSYSGAATNTIRGLDHLNTQLVTVFSTDGTIYTGVGPVADGAISLPGGATVTGAVVGIPYVSKLKTLRVDLGEPTQQGKRKLISSVTVIIDMTTGFSIGPDSSHVTLWNPNALNFDGEIVNSLYSGNFFVNMKGGWDTLGQMYMEQTKPLPFTILGVVPEVVLGDTSK